MSVQRVISTIHWEPGYGVDPREGLTFSDSTKIRLDPADHRVKLKLNETSWRYPTDTGLSVRSKTVAPTEVDRLQMIQVVYGDALPDGTSVKLRLYDGAAEWWWDGSAWDNAPAAGEWNTEAEINAHLSTYDVVTRREFGVVLNLLTTDGKVTPTVAGVKVLWRGDFDWMEALLVDSLVAFFQDNATYEVDMALPPLAADAGPLDLDDYADAAGDLVFTGAVSVHDYDADPQRKVNLLSSYNSTTHVLTLTAADAIPAGNRPIIRMKARVNAAWDTHRDFEEIGKLPQIVLHNSEIISSAPYPSAFGDNIVNRATSAAVEIPPPYNVTLKVAAEVRVERNSREQAAVSGSLIKLLSAGPDGELGPFLRFLAVDTRARVLLLDEYRARALTAVDWDGYEADVSVSVIEFLIQNVGIQLKDAIDSTMVAALKMSYSNVPSGQRETALAAEAPIPRSTPETIETN